MLRKRSFEPRGATLRSTNMRRLGEGWTLIWALVLAHELAAQSSVVGPQLPAPAGPFAIGRVTLMCEDKSRLEPLDPSRAPRRIMVDVWYPADAVGAKASPPAVYGDVKAIERVIGPEGLRKQLGAAYEVIRSGNVTTHANEGAPFASSLPRAPLLIFSPGGGMIRDLYTAQLEYLASYGYVVAAITHTYDGFITIFPDGTSAVYDSKRWPSQPSVEGEANLNQLEWHADDMLFVLDELSHAPSSAPFAGRLDLTRVGAFGHSFGGIVSAHACQKDERIKACLNQDGAVAMQPYFLDARGWGMNQAFMLIERAPRIEPPSDQELAEMKLTRERAHQLLDQLNSSRDRALRATGGGTYRVLLQRKATSHMDFSDLGVLGAGTPVEQETKERTLAAVNSYTRAFFDRYLRKTKSPLLDAKSSDSLIETVQRFSRSRPPR
jgi:pimeloyl-ACP methyl ester carboxylesterase